MPIKPENKALYPPDWKAIRFSILHRAGNQCEWCGAANRNPHPITFSMVVLTIAHIDQNPRNNDPVNLAALCQKCHLTHDAKQHAANARLTREAKKGLQRLQFTD
jgi:5-methylcytosine-specific restriction endonuclease McrA